MRLSHAWSWTTPAGGRGWTSTARQEYGRRRSRGCSRPFVPARPPETTPGITRSLRVPARRLVRRVDGRTSAPERGSLAAQYESGSLDHVVDVGGGTGEMLRPLLAADSHVHDNLFDLPQVVAGRSGGARRAAARMATYSPRSFLVVEGVIPDRRSAGEASFDPLTLSEADSERWTSSGDVRSPPI
jgi:hypothetical protein